MSAGFTMAGEFVEFRIEGNRPMIGFRLLDAHLVRQKKIWEQQGKKGHVTFIPERQQTSRKDRKDAKRRMR